MYIVLGFVAGNKTPLHSALKTPGDFGMFFVTLKNFLNKDRDVDTPQKHKFQQMEKLRPRLVCVCNVIIEQLIILHISKIQFNYFMFLASGMQMIIMCM